MTAATTFVRVDTLKAKIPKNWWHAKDHEESQWLNFICLRSEENEHYLEILNLSDVNLVIIIELFSFKIFFQFTNAA